MFQLINIDGRGLVIATDKKLNAALRDAIFRPFWPYIVAPLLFIVSVAAALIAVSALLLSGFNDPSLQHEFVVTGLVLLGIVLIMYTVDTSLNRRSRRIRIRKNLSGNLFDPAYYDWVIIPLDDDIFHPIGPIVRSESNEVKASLLAYTLLCVKTREVYEKAPRTQDGIIKASRELVYHLQIIDIAKRFQPELDRFADREGTVERAIDLCLGSVRQEWRNKLEANRLMTVAEIERQQNLLQVIDTKLAEAST